MQQVSTVTQIFSFTGALLILCGYAGSQFGWMDARRSTYNILNAVGSAILGVIALYPFQLGFVVLEFAWVAISIYALFRAMRQKPAE
jgi:hypothetical protein